MNHVAKKKKSMPDKLSDAFFFPLQTPLLLLRLTKYVDETSIKLPRKEVEDLSITDHFFWGWGGGWGVDVDANGPLT